MTSATSSDGTATATRDAAEPALPGARGPLSAHVMAALRGEPGSLAPPPVDVRAADPLGDDAQLALYLCYELHYRGFAGVDAEWEWDAGLLSLRGTWERAFLAALRAGTEPGSDATAALEPLLEEPVEGTGVSHHLLGKGEWWQMREYLALRSVYHLKEADPHAWVIPRLQGQAKASLVAVEFDEFGGGRGERLHARLFADMMAQAGLDPAYGRYLDAAPTPMLAVVNMMSLFGLHRSLRGALVGHFAAAETSSSPSAFRMAKALQRLGAGPRGAFFYTEHVEADAVHEQVVRNEVMADLLDHEPALAQDVVLGIRATDFVEARLAEHILTNWHKDRTCLRRPLPQPATS
ncbi:iron-containing redox enzyme family protein [Wenjunlia tyrosinilytica]|uniref:Iron-containing redox enzyme family protein n=1 Tax=Wenjunlia tyrosinilytica TaxID=1544741 RepID=A0A917ZTN9_9ACTN|nr:iron-containing redox enzyme family protein [Wenjunlia tyrosinilytica]GGO91194.1 hypothetical protein GCM10012280_38470 [Wenjunlia tyrosinilytica]